MKLLTILLLSLSVGQAESIDIASYTCSDSGELSATTLQLSGGQSLYARAYIPGMELCPASANISLLPSSGVLLDSAQFLPDIWWFGIQGPSLTLPAATEVGQFEISTEVTWAAVVTGCALDQLLDQPLDRQCLEARGSGSGIMTLGGWNSTDGVATIFTAVYNLVAADVDPGPAPAPSGAPVPEPASWLLLAGSVGVLLSIKYLRSYLWI